MNASKNARAGICQDASIDKVDDLLDESKEEMEPAEEISNALAQPVEPLMGDDDALLVELQSWRRWTCRSSGWRRWRCRRPQDMMGRPACRDDRAINLPPLRHHVLAAFTMDN